jgi:hypothetical protein
MVACEGSPVDSSSLPVPGRKFYDPTRTARTFARSNQAARGTRPCCAAGAMHLGRGPGRRKQGKLAVGCVVRNRLRTRIGFGSTWNQVILQENAFSCFLKGDANHEKVMRPLDGQGVTAVSVWNECYECAREIYYDFIVDPTHGATFYHDKTDCWRRLTRNSSMPTG